MLCMGLTSEEVRRRDEEHGMEGLLTAMGDCRADAAAIAASEDGKVMARIPLFQKYFVKGISVGTVKG